MRKFWVKHALFMQKYWCENSAFLHDLDLTLVKSKLEWGRRVKWLSLSMSTCKLTHKTCVAWHACDFYFLVTLCGLALALIFPGITFLLTQYYSQIFTCTLGEFEFFDARLTLQPQKCKEFFLYIWPHLNVTRDHYVNLKMLNMG